jgi:hypothetical protein
MEQDDLEQQKQTTSEAFSLAVEYLASCQKKEG